MSAGLSNKQIYRRVYSRLHRIQRELAAVGIETEYRNYQLVYREPAGPSVGGFNISFRILRASNGEVAGLPSVYISAIAVEVKRYDHLMFLTGIERIKELFTPTAYLK